MDLNKLYPFDIETFPNVFTLWIGNAGKRKAWCFEISDRKDERKRMVQFLGKVKREGGSMVGFNNIGFDYPVLHFILNNQDCTVEQIYNKAMEIISAQNDDKFKHLVWERDWIIDQIDLFKIHHFDNIARATSLKMLEFNMRSDNIEDLPFEVGTNLDEEQTKVLHEYNKHDMAQTDKFMRLSLAQMDFRKQLSEQYGKNFMNHNDGKIGKDYFIMKLEEEIPNSCYKVVGGRKVMNQTKRKFIDLNECIFPYIKFERPEFQAVLKWIREQKITETKGVFTDILESDLGDLAQYCELDTKRQKQFRKPTEKKLAELKAKHPMGWLSEEVLKSGKVSYYWNWRVASNLHCVVNGFRYDFGTGGIHGSVSSRIVRRTDKKRIIDQDVASYYPNMAISNRIYPEHLGESFCDIYLDVYNQRKSYKKGTPENAMLKLALNSVYGDSNNKFSPFYDPKYTMSITIGGQLSLCMLAEELIKIDGLEIIQVNTDGLTYYVDDDKVDQAQQVCNDWEKVTKLELEGVEYELMAIRDVNSYISKTMDGKLKNKGAYVWDDLGWHQNHSMKIVAMAAEKALIEDEEIGYFIRNHKEKMDFMLRAKVPRSSKLLIIDDTGHEERVQNITRYYACKSGDGELVKVMPPLTKKRYGNRMVHPETGETVVTENKTDYEKFLRKGYEKQEEVLLENPERRIGVNAGVKVKVCNDIKDYIGDIDYDFYINECRKLVNPLLEGTEV